MLKIRNGGIRFLKMVTEHKTIYKKSLKFDLLLFLIDNRIYLNRILNFLKR